MRGLGVEGVEELGAVVAHVVDLGADRVGLEAARCGGHQQLLELVDVGETGIEPGGVPLGLDQERHPVVDVTHRVLGGRGQHRAGPGEPLGVVLVAGRVAPDLVEPGHREHAAVGRADEERLLDGLAGLGLLLGGVPLEVAVRRQQAPPRRERPPERRLLVHGLHAGVDHLVADRGVLGPERHQSPAHRAQLTLGRRVLIRPRVPRRSLHDGVHLLGGRDVVVGGKGLLDLDLVDLELLDEVLRSTARRVAATHGARLVRRQRVSSSSSCVAESD